MSQFVKVGTQWLNLDQVLRIEFLPSLGSGAPMARVHFTAGRYEDFKDQAEVKEIDAFLTTHKAT